MNCDKTCHVGGGEISSSYQNPVKVCLQKKTISQNSKDSLIHSELQGSLPCSEEHATGIYPQQMNSLCKEDSPLLGHEAIPKSVWLLQS
jgi:hypothetical protein